MDKPSILQEWRWNDKVIQVHVSTSCAATQIARDKGANKSNSQQRFLEWKEADAPAIPTFKTEEGEVVAETLRKAAQARSKGVITDKYLVNRSNGAGSATSENKKFQSASE